MAAQCTHLDQIKIKHTKTHVCEECVKTGDTWVHLRLCLICGHVGCCDSSKTSTPPSISTKQNTLLSDRSSPVRLGYGATSTKWKPARSRIKPVPALHPSFKLQS